MFKVAPRYLSGVSVFLGDDITRRDTDGELAIFVGQATKGPQLPVQLQSIDNAIAIYGGDNPLVKAVYEFYDGYVDAGKNQNLKFVTLRIGGVQASFVTSYGLSGSTVDAYNGIEDDYFAYVNTNEGSVQVKFWDKNKLLVFDSVAGINTGHFTIDELPTFEAVGRILGVDIDEDPLETPVKLSEIINLDVINPTGAPLALNGALTALSTEIVVTGDISEFPSVGVLKVSRTVAAVTTTVFAEYSDFDAPTSTFTLVEAFGTAMTTGTVSLVGSTLITGDSQLSLTERVKYEKFRNALLDVEIYTPDYIVPGGVDYNAAVAYTKVNNKSALLKQNLTDASTYVQVDAAKTWPAAGTIDIFDGTDHNYMAYTANTPLGSDFRLELSKPVFTLSGATVQGESSITVTGATAAEIKAAGYVKIGTGIYHYTTAAVTPTILTLATPIAVGDAGQATVTKVAGAALANVTVVKTTFNTTQNFTVGIGYVKETDEGGSFSFAWSNTKLPGYYLAHFGYLFAKFCNDATIGYNTPLCGMNVTLPSKFDRLTLASWIGKKPEFKVRVDNNEAVEAVTNDGTGLLGDATLAGAVDYNRTYMTKADEGFFADPAYGLLLTDEGFVDGHELKDTYEKVVDLGKYLIVGAGLITFQNRAAGSAYVDACGLYTLGLLAGKPKNEGIAFSKIGKSSNATVSVIVNRNQYNDLASLGYIVVTREKGLGWVINNSHSAARNDSGYYLITTTRTVKYVVEGKRSILVSFIGKPASRYVYEAARTRLAESFQDDVKNGLLGSAAQWDLIPVISAKALGKFELRCKLNPALELTQVDIDAVIERSSILQ